MMFIQQFFVRGISHSSYLLGGTQSCAIIDPRRDVEVYIEAAQEMGMTITHILQTHLHADFVSGHLDLADKTGAAVYVPQSAHCLFSHKGVSEGDIITLEDMRIEVRETPGHTPEHISYVVVDLSRGREPAALFCGDTLFVGDVGRPDLFPGRARELASKLYQSLHKKLLRLPDFCQVFPAHGAGSLCGRTIGAQRFSTIGYEKLYNPALQIKDEEEFIQSLTTNMPPAPDHFSRCSAVNGQGPRLVKDLPPLIPLPPGEFRSQSLKDTTVVLDIRSFESFSSLHVPDSYHIDLRGNFATFAGWIIPPDKDILLVVDSVEQAQGAVVWLRRVGLDRTVGYLKDGMLGWVQAGFTTMHVPQLSVDELHKMIADRRSMVLVDVRTPGEYSRYHIENALNIPVPDLRVRYQELDKECDIVLICSTGMRSTMGASILEMNGFSRVLSVAGGMTGYSAAGYAR